MKTRNNKKRLIIITILIILVILVCFVCIYQYKNKQRIKEEQLKVAKEKAEYEQMIKDVKQAYNKYVKNASEKILYKIENNKYIEYGKIGKDIELVLEDINIDNIDSEYFKLEGKDYYITYDNLEKIDNISVKNQRYKSYIPFNENIVTKGTTSFYKDSNLVYSINKSFEFPIIVKLENSYGVDFAGELLYINKEDVDTTKQVDNNSKVRLATDIPVLLYHFFHPAGSHPEYESWTTVISLRADKLESQLKYLKENNYMTLKMYELEMFIDGQINLPKNSVVLTIDDGNPTIYSIAYPIIEKYETNFTVFNIGSAYPDAIDKATKYVEIHSHTYDMHKGGCSGGQGGLIKCIDYNLGIEDLKKSKEQLNDSKYLAYPFGEYTEHSMKLLKDAGFTMAFTTNYGDVKVGMDKLQLPRYYVYNEWTLNKFINIVN